MRISDWSSDVCSSDLDCRNSGGFARLRRAGLLLAVKAASICGLHVKLVGAPSQPPTSRAEGLRSCETDSPSPGISAMQPHRPRAAPFPVASTAHITVHDRLFSSIYTSQTRPQYTLYYYTATPAGPPDPPP